MRRPIAFPDVFQVQTRRDTSVKGEGLAIFRKDDPIIRTMRWNGLAGLDIHYRGIRAGAQQIDDHRIAWRGEDHALQAYDVAPTEELHEGGLEIEVVLPSRPAVNAWSFEIPNWEDYDFDYQAPLAYADADDATWEWNPWHERRQRPAHVNGSYAVYARNVGGHFLGDLNYEIGKVTHIFRPKAIDATGRWAWADLHFRAGVLTVTVPWSFLEGAAYPVRVDPTFGYSGTAASDDNFGAARILCKAVTTPASNGDATSCTVKGRVKSGTNPEHDPAIYANSGSAPGSRLAAVDTGGTVYSGSDAEVTKAITLAGLVSGTQYWPGSRNNNCGTSATTSDAFFKYDASGGTGNMYFSVHNFDPTTAWQSSASGFTAADNEKVYIYITYTASATFIAPAPFVKSRALHRAAYW